MSLAEHVRILGRGPGRSRSLTEAEARDAMEIVLSGAAAPEAVGALLMLLRMKGETAEEIAGLAAGAQAGLPALPPVDLDWPSYAAGRSRGLPWFLLAARLVAMDGHRVLLHGWNGPRPEGARWPRPGRDPHGPHAGRHRLPAARDALARAVQAIDLARCSGPAILYQHGGADAQSRGARGPVSRGCSTPPTG